MAKSWLLGQPAEILNAGDLPGAHTGTIVRTFVSKDSLQVVIQQDGSGNLITVSDVSLVRVLAEPKTN